jgi:hypothetical protein
LPQNVSVFSIGELEYSTSSKKLLPSISVSAVILRYRLPTLAVTSIRALEDRTSTAPELQAVVEFWLGALGQKLA